MTLQQSLSGGLRLSRKTVFRWLFLAITACAAILALGAIVLSLQPWSRAPAPMAARLVDGALIFDGAGFNSPDTSPEQTLTVVRDFWGHAQTLRIAQLPGQPPPTPAEQGVRLLLTPEDAARLEDRAVTVEVSYNPSTTNSAEGLAVSLQGIGPADWVSVPTPPEPHTVRFELPPQLAVNAVGLRVLSSDTEQAHALEITRVSVVPHDTEPPAN